MQAVNAIKGIYEKKTFNSITNSRKFKLCATLDSDTGHHLMEGCKVFTSNRPRPFLDVRKLLHSKQKKVKNYHDV